MKNSQEPKPKSSTKPGTIWQLGDHRLAFGDARDKALLARLVGREKINLICADVPYGIGVVESKRNFKSLAKDKAIANDHLQSDTEYRTFTKDWLTAISPFLARKNAAYIFNADRMVFALRDGMDDAGFKFAQLLIWVKSQAVIGRLDYAPMHELIVYCWHGTHLFRRSKDKSVLFYPKPSKSVLHPTTKPIGLIRRLVLNSTNIMNAVYDGFCGSGTTLLVCEQTKRRCFAIEIDEEYCMTTIRQWEKMTGRKAKSL